MEFGACGGGGRANGGQRYQIPLEQELQEIVRSQTGMLETELRSPVRAACVCNC